MPRIAFGPLLVLLPVAAWAAEPEFRPLFPEGTLDGWSVSDWSNVATDQKTEGLAWKLEDETLIGLNQRTWTYSQDEYADFVLKFEWKISAGANGGVGVRFPPEGDPAYEGLEIQI